MKICTPKHTLNSTITTTLPDKRQFVVTSDTSRNADVVDFIARITTRIHDYDVILASPTMSTGVDISFNNDEQVVDHVFGFFEPLVTTHFECDQQISRVRHPKKVSVYVAPAVFGFETNIDVVESDLLKGRLFDQFITGYDDTNRPVFRASDALLDLACSVVSHQRASKNNLRKHFAQHKTDQGYEVHHIKTELSRSDVGKDAMREGAGIAWEEYVKLLQASRPIDDTEFSQLLGRLENNEFIDASERLCLERKRIESFYRQEILADLRAASLASTSEELIGSLSDASAGLGDGFFLVIWHLHARLISLGAPSPRSDRMATAKTGVLTSWLRYWGRSA